MSLTTLMTVDDPFFAFDHYMAHSQLYGVMAPLDRFTVLPYLLDPMPSPVLPGQFWDLAHATAHADFLQTLPSYYGAPITGLAMANPLLDSDLQNPDRLEWWTFLNLIEHQMAANAVLPAWKRWTFPFA